MSDHLIVIIPEKPETIPEESSSLKAIKYLNNLASNSQVSIQHSHKTQFYDCGQNFESVSCPNCNEVIPVDWWQDKMSTDYTNNDFQMNKYSTPCCNSSFNLNELNYNWEQGFAHFSLELRNPGIGKLSINQKKDLEQLLGAKIKVIYKSL